MSDEQEALSHPLEGNGDTPHQAGDPVSEPAGEALDHDDIRERGLINHGDAIKQSEALMLAAKELRAAALKVEKKQQEEEDARRLARELQEEVNAILSARLDKEDTSQMRSPEKVQKEVLKAHNKVDRAIESANREEEKAEEAYLKLMSLVIAS